MPLGWIEPEIFHTFTRNGYTFNVYHTYKNDDIGSTCRQYHYGLSEHVSDSSSQDGDGPGEDGAFDIRDIPGYTGDDSEEGLKKSIENAAEAGYFDTVLGEYGTPEHAPTFPKAETWYCWREFSTVEGEDAPRLLVPWSDPREYEYAADGLFTTREEAITWKAEFANGERWQLCQMTLTPLEEHDWIRWSQHYPDGKCPDCGLAIDPHTGVGDGCPDCEHVFNLPRPTDDQTDAPTTDGTRTDPTDEAG